MREQLQQGAGICRGVRQLSTPGDRVRLESGPASRWQRAAPKPEYDDLAPWPGSTASAAASLCADGVNHALGLEPWRLRWHRAMTPATQMLNRQSRSF